MIGFTPDGGLVSGGVTATTTLGLSSVWRSLDILANGVSQLPWRELRGNLELPPSRIVSRPSAFYTRREWVSLVVSTLALFDVCYLLKTGGYDAEGVPLGLFPIDPTMIQPTTLDYWSLVPPDEYQVGLERIPASELVILRRSPQPTVPETLAGVLQLARTAFAASIAADRYASRYWQAGGAPTTVLETDQTMDDGEATQLSDRWAQRRAKGPDHAPVLSGGLTAKSFGADPTAESAVEARREQVADVGRYFGIPTKLLNAPTGDSETYASSEQSDIQLVRLTLQNYIGAIEDGITGELPGGRHMAMDPWILTAGTFLARAQAYQLATNGDRPWMDSDDVRIREGLPPREIPPVASSRPIAAGAAPAGGSPA